MEYIIEGTENPGDKIDDDVAMTLSTCAPEQTAEQGTPGWCSALLCPFSDMGKCSLSREQIQRDRAEQSVREKPDPGLSTWCIPACSFSLPHFI